MHGVWIRGAQCPFQERQASVFSSSVKNPVVEKLALHTSVALFPLKRHFFMRDNQFDGETLDRGLRVTLSCTTASASSGDT